MDSPFSSLSNVEINGSRQSLFKRLSAAAWPYGRCWVEGVGRRDRRHPARAFGVAPLLTKEILLWIWRIAAFDHALFAGAGMAIGVSPAGAQQTPASYCAALPSTSCEVLNIELGGFDAGGGGLGMVKYCRNGQFQVVPISTSGGTPAGPAGIGSGTAGGGLLTIFTSSGYRYAYGGKGNCVGSCTYIGASAWTSSSLCGFLP